MDNLVAELGELHEQEIKLDELGAANELHSLVCMKLYAQDVKKNELGAEFDDLEKYYDLKAELDE